MDLQTWDYGLAHRISNSADAIWWKAFCSGMITVQTCRKCLRDQLPIGTICRFCRSQNDLGTRVFHDEVNRVGSTKVTTPAAPEFEAAVPFTITTFEADSGVRITMPECASVVQSSRVKEPAAIVPCKCSLLPIPHIQMTFGSGE